LHGDLRQAAAYNPLTLLLLPLLLVWGARTAVRMLQGGRAAPGRRLPAWSIRALFVLILVFWVLRNLPFAPFDQLAPHAVERETVTASGERGE
jgi:hypothetical protein